MTIKEFLLKGGSIDINKPDNTIITADKYNPQAHYFKNIACAHDTYHVYSKDNHAIAININKDQLFRQMKELTNIDHPNYVNY